MGAERVASRELLLSSALILLMLLSVLTPILSISPSEETPLEENQVIAPSTSFSNGNGEEYESWEEVQLRWFQTPSQFLSHVDVLDKVKGFK